MNLNLLKEVKLLVDFILHQNAQVLIIFGKDERNKVEEIRNQLSSKALKVYDDEEVYRDSKWVLFELEDLSLVEDIKKLLLKRKQKKK